MLIIIKIFLGWGKTSGEDLYFKNFSDRKNDRFRWNARIRKSSSKACAGHLRPWLHRNLRTASRHSLLSFFLTLLEGQEKPRGE